jgi:hypothetical protein
VPVHWIQGLAARARSESVDCTCLPSRFRQPMTLSLEFCRINTFAEEPSSWHGPTSLNPARWGHKQILISFSQAPSQNKKRNLFSLPQTFFSSLFLRRRSRTRSRPRLASCQPKSFNTKSFTSSLFFASSSPLAPRAASSAALGHVPFTRFGLVFFVQHRNYAKSRKMPPKKQVVEEKIPLGRPGNNLKSGIVRHHLSG